MAFYLFWYFLSRNLPSDWSLCSDFPEVLCDSDKDLSLSDFLLRIFFFLQMEAFCLQTDLCSTVSISYSAVMPSYPKGTGKMQIALSVWEIKVICPLFLVSS